jgi:hypothetical protein
MLEVAAVGSHTAEAAGGLSGESGELRQRQSAVSHTVQVQE